MKTRLTQKQSYADLISNLIGTASGEHAHKCACGNRWSHSDSFQFDPNISRERFTALHTCDKCGTEVWVKDMDGAGNHPGDRYASVTDHD